jgi:predicted transcriptional regulator
MTLSHEALGFNYHATQPYFAQTISTKNNAFKAAKKTKNKSAITSSQQILHTLLDEKGYKPFQLIRALAIPRSTFYDLLSGRVKLPQQKTFKKIWDFYLQVIAEKNT